MNEEDVAELVSADDPRWGEALQGVRHDVYHRPEYVAYDAAGSGEPCAFLFRDGHLALIVPLVLRAVPGADAVDATSPYGYPGPVSNASLDDEGFWARACAALVGVLRERGAITCFLRLHPLLPLRLDVLGRHGRLVQHGHTVSIDLRAPEEVQWGDIRKRDRSYINRCVRQGMSTTFDDWSLLPDVARAYAETMERRGAGAAYRYDADDFVRLRSALGDDLHLVAVRHEGEVVSGTFLLERSGIVQLHLRGTLDSALDLQANKLETDAVRRWAGQRGDSVMHLGGGLGGAEDSLFRFKAGFSPDRNAFFTWRAVLDVPAHDALVTARGGEVGDRTGGDFFPLYRRSSGD